MSAVSVFVVLAGTTIDLVAAWHFLRGRKETSAARVRTLGHRARTLTFLALFLGFVAAVAGVAVAFHAVESVALEQRAAALTDRISEAMNGAIWGLVFAVPSLMVTLMLMGRARAIQREGAAKER